MASGKIGIEGLIDPAPVVTYQKTAADVGAMLGRFLRGAHDKWVFCASESDFRNSFGEVALPGYELDYEVALSYFRASEGNGRLWVRNVFWYGIDPVTGMNPSDGITAAKASTVAGGLTPSHKLYFLAYSRGDWPHQDKYALEVEIRETTNRASGSGRVDVLVYYNGVLKKSYLDLSYDPTVDPQRNVRDSIPSVGDGWIIPVFNSTGITPTLAKYEFANGNNGLTGPLSEPLLAKHWIGERHALGNSGFYGLLPLLNDVSRRPTFIINQLGNESYEWTHYSALTSFCRSYWLTHFSCTPQGLNRTEVSNWKMGTGDDDRSTLYGEARVAWPWFYPRGCADTTLVIPPCGADAGRMVARIHSSGGHVHEPYVGTDGDHGSLALVTTRLQMDTGPDDRDTLNPLGICVISSDLGGIYLDGGRTMATDFRFLEMSSRRHLAVVIMAGLLAQSRWLIHGLNDEGQPNSPGIWRRGTMSGQTFMRKYASDGAFTSPEMGVGWKFDLGAPYTTSDDVLDRVARAKVGFCPRSAAEMIYFALGVEENQLSAAPATSATT